MSLEIGLGFSRETEPTGYVYYVFICTERERDWLVDWLKAVDTCDCAGNSKTCRVVTFQVQGQWAHVMCALLMLTAPF